MMMIMYVIIINIIHAYTYCEYDIIVPLQFSSQGDLRSEYITILTAIFNSN